MMNTTTSGSRRAISVAAWSGQSKKPGSAETARHARVEVGLHDAGRARDLAERGPERAGQRVAADPEPQRVGRSRAGGSRGPRWWSWPRATTDAPGLACTVPGERGLVVTAEADGVVATSSATATTASTLATMRGDPPGATAPAVAAPVTAIGGAPGAGCGIGHGGGARRRARSGPGPARAPGREGETTMLTGGSRGGRRHAASRAVSVPNAALQQAARRRLLHRAGDAAGRCPGGAGRCARGARRAAPRAAPASRG